MCDSKECVYHDVIDHLVKPIVIFTASNGASSVSDMTCLMQNKAFFDLTNHHVEGMKLIDSFPILLELMKQQPPNLKTIEAIEYEDKYVPKGMYTLLFHRPNKLTLAIKILHISEEIKAKLLSEEIAMTKEQFVANVSHEIRTPLNGILGYISMMSDPKELSTLTDYQKNCFEQIYDCSMNLLYIMNDILDFSKLNADQMQLKEAPFDLAECLEKSYDVIKPSAYQKGLEVAFYIHPNVPPRVKGDFKKLRQILLNLLSNGIKFTSKGRIDTTVGLLMDSATKSELDVQGRYTIEFTVEDTGIGISEKNQSKLFKSFSQIDQSNHKIYQGTGLGLVISKKLVELMDGTIRVESAEGAGSKFIFTIKVEEARAISDDTTDTFMHLLKDKSVLVVDDHVTNRITIASNLVQWGMKPFVCGSAEEALLFLRSGVMKYDFALIDMRMPKMDGNELAEKIKSIEPNLPLIAISSTGITTAALNKNFNFYLSKPIKLRQLCNVCIATVRKISSDSMNTPDKSHNMLPPAHTSPTTNLKKEKQIIDPEISFYTPSISYPVPICHRVHRSVLIAEDLKTNQRVIQGFLEKLGFRDFTVVEDGKATMEAVAKKHFDIIMMDLKMPHIDGFEATKRIRKFYQQRTDKRPTQPFIVALTANTMGNIKERCIAAGMDAYICKPINLTELANILNQ